MISAELVSKVIREQRKKAGLSQEVLSGLADLDRTHYSKIERGLRLPILDTFFKICQALNIQPHQLMLIIEKELQNTNNIK